MSRSKRRKGIRAWAITWEWEGDHRRPTREFVTLLPSRWGSSNVRRILETLYANSGEFTFGETLNFVKRPNQFFKNRYYAASGDLVCGDNPYLIARIVEDVFVEHDNHKTQTLHWTTPESRRYNTGNKNGVVDKPAPQNHFTVTYDW